MTSRGIVGSAFFLTVLCIALAGCGDSVGSDDGPLRTFAPHDLPMADIAGLSVKPGRSADFDVYIVNSGDSPVRVTGATIVPVPGLPTPRLLHVGLEHGKNEVGGQRDWPPDTPPVTPLVGHVIPHGLHALAVGITGSRIGTTYSTAGVRLAYRTDGATHYATAYGGGQACIVARPPEDHGCDFSGKTEARIRHYIHSQ